MDVKDDPRYSAWVAPDRVKLAIGKYAARNEHMAEDSKQPNPFADRQDKPIPRMGPRDSVTVAQSGTSTDRTFREGFAQHLTEHATGLLTLADRLRKGALPIEAEFQGLELQLKELAAHVVKFKSVLIP